MAGSAEASASYTLWLLFITAMEVIALVYVLFLSIRANRTSGRAVQSAEEANIIAKDAIEIETRPWITVKPEIVSDLTWNGGSGNLLIQFLLKNIGKTPALNVGIGCKLIVSGLGYGNPIEEQKTFSEAFRVQDSSSYPSVLFPAEEILHKWTEVDPIDWTAWQRS